jgi:hypothetical protein
MVLSPICHTLTEPSGRWVKCTRYVRPCMSLSDGQIRTLIDQRTWMARDPLANCNGALCTSGSCAYSTSRHTAHPTDAHLVTFRLTVFRSRLLKTLVPQPKTPKKECVDTADRTCHRYPNKKVKSFQNLKSQIDALVWYATIQTLSTPCITE